MLQNAGYCQAMVGFDVPFNTYVHICGTDIVRDETGTFRVLEDNARTPSRRRVCRREPPHEAFGSCPI